MSKKNDSSNEQKSTTDAPRAASPMQSAPLTQKNKPSLPKSKENVQKVQQYHHQQKDEIEIYYKKLSEWLRGDVDKNKHTTFTFFERRLPDIFSAVLAIKRTEEESNHGVSANLTLNATAYKERLFEMWGKCKGDYNVTLSNFQTSHTTQIGEGSTLIGCTYQTEERLIDSVGEMFFYSKTVSVLMKCNVVNRSDTTEAKLKEQPTSTSPSSTTAETTTTFLTLHESWNEDPRICELEESLNELKIKNINSMLNSTKKNLKRKGLTLASVKYNNSSGKHVVVNGPPRVDDNDDDEVYDDDDEGEMNIEEDDFDETKNHCRFWLNGNCTKGDSCYYLHDPFTHGRNRRSRRVMEDTKEQEGKRGEEDDDNYYNTDEEKQQEEDAYTGGSKEGDDDEDEFISTGMYRVLEARFNNYVELMERHGFVSTLTFVKHVTRHFVFLCKRFNGAINLQQMLMMRFLMPRTVAVSKFEEILVVDFVVVNLIFFDFSRFLKGL
jgi:hypothetical protein